MDPYEALDLLRRAVLACMDAKIKIGVRPVDWARQIEIIADGVGVRDGRFVMLETLEGETHPLLHSKTDAGQPDEGRFAGE